MAKHVDTRPSALQSTLHFWKSRRIASIWTQIDRSIERWMDADGDKDREIQIERGREIDR